MSKHTSKPTPGPWFYDGENSCSAHVIHVAEGEIAEVFSDSGFNASANANLIAAAPSLLTACDEAETAFAVLQLQDNITHRNMITKTRRLCQDAIALAKPGSAFAEAVRECRNDEADEITRLRSVNTDLIKALEASLRLSDQILAEGYELDDDEQHARQMWLAAIAKAKGE